MPYRWTRYLILNMRVFRFSDMVFPASCPIPAPHVPHRNTGRRRETQGETETHESCERSRRTTESRVQRGDESSYTPRVRIYGPATLFTRPGPNFCHRRQNPERLQSTRSGEKGALHNLIDAIQKVGTFSSRTGSLVCRVSFRCWWWRS